MNEGIEFYFKLFVNRDDVYLRQYVNLEGSFSYLTIYEPVTTDLIAKHLLGSITLAFPATDKTGLTKFAVWDNDSESTVLERIKCELQKLKFNPLLEGKRPGREGHLWLFLDEKIAAADLIRFNKEILRRAGVSEKDVEFFPKQANAGKCSNGIRGPLGIHQKPGANGARGFFEGALPEVEEQLNWLSQQTLNRTTRIKKIVSRLRENDKALAKYTCRSLSLKKRLDPKTVFADLRPEDKGDYLICNCPKCGAREAFIYKAGAMLICNRRRTCNFKVSIAAYSVRKRTH